jgi:hypothetical protein
LNAGKSDVVAILSSALTRSEQKGLRYQDEPRWGDLHYTIWSGSAAYDRERITFIFLKDKSPRPEALSKLFPLRNSFDVFTAERFYHALKSTTQTIYLMLIMDSRVNPIEQSP